MTIASLTQFLYYFRYRELIIDLLVEFCCFCFPYNCMSICGLFFFSSRRWHTRCYRDWSSDVCSSDLIPTFSHPFPIKCQELHLSTAQSSARLGRQDARSEERRVGKECRSRWSPDN